MRNARIKEVKYMELLLACDRLRDDLVLEEGQGSFLTILVEAEGNPKPSAPPEPCVHSGLPLSVDSESRHPFHFQCHCPV